MGKVAGGSAQGITWWEYFPSLKDKEYGRDWKTLLRTRDLKDGSCHQRFSTSFSPFPLLHCRHVHCLKYRFRLCFLTHYCCYCGDFIHLNLLFGRVFCFFVWRGFLQHITEFNGNLFVVMDFGLNTVAVFFFWTHIWSHKPFSETSCTLWSLVNWKF